MPDPAALPRPPVPSSGGEATRPGAARFSLAQHRDTLAVLGEKVSVVSHELRGPLNTAMNALFLARHALGDRLAGPARGHLETAERQLERAALLVDQVLELSRPRFAQISSLKIGDVLADVFEVLPPPPGVDVQCTGEHVVARADRVQLVELLGNLVANAYDAMPRGGSLIVEAGRVGADVLVAVEDTGSGFEPGQGSRLFEPFVTTKPGGTGLGLAIVQRIADAHGGDVQMRNVAGGGTAVTVRLPGAAEGVPGLPSSTGSAGHPVPR